ncbi:DNA translocase FtsK [Amnibacterium kyonggiense]|uniref:FtsK-like protein n=1 Tax=Amnibacterium kyonggiense TaxID=595671 RepID=A0A4R7FLR5_9MICO|nr:DNA translocase FtsK [Amnibacterium kyonggiense]TDS77319.1 FtsK-like protein [Amnibacterium kyonggiense]
MPSPLSVARPVVVALLLLAAVGVTAAVLYAYWPAGVAVGVALGAGAVLAIGSRMQVSERRHPVDVELAATLGIAPAEPATAAEPVDAAPSVDEPAPAPAKAARIAVPAVRALDVQPDVLYFTSDDDPDSVEVREVVTAANDIIVVPEQQPAPVEAAPAARVAEPSAEPGADAVAEEEPVVAEPLAGAVRADLEQLKADLGDDYRDFARAARLVVSTQYASAARLQRDLDLPYSRARRLLSDLEQQHFVGPATGSLPRQVLLPKERLPEVEQLLAEV